ncbi:MAG: site-specific DNA-methyltransferase [Acidimicrobiales bacterium]|nr:site-specific DNA-methyltransferase [Acidimicrobiales bacterium]MYB81797.1 site-specific DNA-methyltransferase [Acidimicrobiales bacterium]MYI13253.1 site-specific DNA-methyltransferase [Acidimicrobiales bacterium]
MTPREPLGGTRTVAPSARRTATSRFGASRREGHDASAFYERFTPPALSDDNRVARGPDFDAELADRIGDGCFCGDARQMTALPDASVALVVTSPPYFVGKSYEDAIAAGTDDRIPTSYFDYLAMLRDVFAECVRVLEPGGRIAVNVANLGRKPYRSLSGDVAKIFEELGLLLRGEIVWQKSKGSSGSCAWGSFRSPSNPTLRDTTERIVIASKGRFDRARSAAQRRDEGLPHRSSLSTDEFMEATIDVWDMGPESAQRVRHPAPFPLELPRRLIDLYTYEDDLVLDPFMGSGTTLVASVLCGRRPVGYDLNPDYVDLARARVAAATSASAPTEGSHHTAQQPLFEPSEVSSPARAASDVPGFGIAASVTRSESSAPASAPIADAMTADAFVRQAVEAGRKAHDIASELLERSGFEIIRSPATVRGSGVKFSFLVADRMKREWWIDVAGAFTTVRPGLLRADTLWKALGRASVLAAAESEARLLMLTPHLPRVGSEGDRALRTLGPATVLDVIELFDEAAAVRLTSYADGAAAPLAGFWDDSEIG